MYILSNNNYMITNNLFRLWGCWLGREQAPSTCLQKQQFQKFTHMNWSKSNLE